MSLTNTTESHMTAWINGSNQVLLAYQLEWTECDSAWRIATKAEFMANYDRDALLGINGDALDTSDNIICSDGSIPASDIL